MQFTATAVADTAIQAVWLAAAAPLVAVPTRRFVSLLGNRIGQFILLHRQNFEGLVLKACS